MEFLWLYVFEANVVETHEFYLIRSFMQRILSWYSYNWIYPCNTGSYGFWVGIFCGVSKVPAGMVARREDILDYLKKKRNANRVKIIHNKPLSYEEMNIVPVWRKLSTRGLLLDNNLCSRDRQEIMLKIEGLKVIPCGAYRKFLKLKIIRSTFWF